MYMKNTVYANMCADDSTLVMCGASTDIVVANANVALSKTAIC